MFGKPIGYVARSVLPALLAILLGTLLIAWWPPLATALPGWWREGECFLRRGHSASTVGHGRHRHRG